VLAWSLQKAFCCRSLPQVTGEQLLGALENGVSHYPQLEGRFPQVGQAAAASSPVGVAHALLCTIDRAGTTTRAAVRCTGVASWHARALHPGVLIRRANLGLV
jgi:hypothetical protein